MKQFSKIEAIDPENYDASVGGHAAKYGSDGILCPPGKWNEFGLQKYPDGLCEDCPSAQYYGSTTCGDNGDESTVPPFSTTDAPVAPPTDTPAAPPTDAPVVPLDTSENTDSSQITKSEQKNEPKALEDRQYKILSDLYDLTNGEKWSKNNNWLSSQNVCSFQGITCEDKIVTKIELPNNNMEGYFHIHKLLIELPGLKKINIENNNLDIIIWKVNKIESKLEILNVNRIDFEETFESLFEFTSFPELRELSMVSCHIDSEFPFFDKTILPKIEKLDLDDNDFSYIPWEFETIETLTFLSLNDNVINSKLPFEMGTKLPNLKYLYLARNYFKGDAPQSLMKLKNLEVVDIVDRSATYFSERYD